MTITTIKRSSKYLPDVDDKKVEPEIKEKVLSEFKTNNEVGTAMLEMLTNEYNNPIFNKDGDLEFCKFIKMERKVDEELIIKFSK